MKATTKRRKKERERQHIFSLSGRNILGLSDENNIFIQPFLSSLIKSAHHLPSSKSRVLIILAHDRQRGTYRTGELFAWTEFLRCQGGQRSEAHSLCHQTSPSLPLSSTGLFMRFPPRTNRAERGGREGVPSAVRHATLIPRHATQFRAKL